MISIDKSQRIVAIDNARFFAKNLVGSILIFGISLTALKFLLLPEIISLFQRASVLANLKEWILLSGGVVCSVSLFVFPLFLIVQAIILFRHAHELERNGKVIKGDVVEKWVDTTNEQQVYYVCYKYLEDIYAVQKVARDIFQSLANSQKVKILMLEQLPHISRMFL